MMREELGFGADVMEPPLRSAPTVGAAYLLGAAVPLMPYLIVKPALGILISALTTVITLFAVGAIKTVLTARPWWRSGIESIAIGTVAAGITYSVGRALSAR
jgi:vacuolar iron transporter family protein